WALPPTNQRSHRNLHAVACVPQATRCAFAPARGGCPTLTVSCGGSSVSNPPGRPAGASRARLPFANHRGLPPDTQLEEHDGPPAPWNGTSARQRRRRGGGGRFCRALHAAPPATTRLLDPRTGGGRRRRRHLVLESLPGGALRYSDDRLHVQLRPRAGESL